jgi:hypothetical protein
MDEQGPQWINRALYVGGILVEISDDFDGYKAETANDGVLGPVELGFEISVTAYDLDDNDNAREDADMVREVIDAMRLALARCFIFGKMEFVHGGMIDDEGWEAVEKVRDALPEGYLEITPALAAEACLRQEEREAAMDAWLESVGELMEAQKRHPDENITLGEAAERQEKGSAEIRRIVEGEEEKK